jgi:hypothetical protein
MFSTAAGKIGSLIKAKKPFLFLHCQQKTDVYLTFLTIILKPDVMQFVRFDPNNCE